MLFLSFFQAAAAADWLLWEFLPAYSEYPDTTATSRGKTNLKQVLPSYKRKHRDDVFSINIAHVKLQTKGAAHCTYARACKIEEKKQGTSFPLCFRH